MLLRFNQECPEFCNTFISIIRFHKYSDYFYQNLCVIIKNIRIYSLINSNYSLKEYMILF